ncbi:MAG: cupredoxin family copper-binding protein [Actinobacteria bacterium]|nr:cupredoxin family copper-binding protein [Actinomycetota bacterium]
MRRRALLAAAAGAALAAGTVAAAPAAMHHDGASGDRVTISGSTFRPGTLTVDVGTRVTWRNDDFTQHTVTADDGSSDSGRLSNGDTYARTFATAGRFTYHCTIHAFMRGTVELVDPHVQHGKPPPSGAGQGIALRLAGGVLRVRTDPPRPHARAVVERWWRERFAWRVVGRLQLDAHGAGALRLSRAQRGRGRLQVVLPAADGQPRSRARLRVG